MSMSIIYILFLNVCGACWIDITDKKYINGWKMKAAKEVGREVIRRLTYGLYINNKESQSHLICHCGPQYIYITFCTYSNSASIR